MLSQLYSKCWDNLFFFSIIFLNVIKLLLNSPGISASLRKLTVAPPVQKIRCVSVRDPFSATTGPLPAPISSASQPLLINRRPDIMNPPVKKKHRRLL